VTTFSGGGRKTSDTQCRCAANSHTPRMNKGRTRPETRRNVNRDRTTSRPCRRLAVALDTVAAVSIESATTLGLKLSMISATNLETVGVEPTGALDPDPVKQFQL
jgi:hypothetical protein